MLAHGSSPRPLEPNDLPRCLTNGGHDPAVVMGGPSDCGAFEAYVETILIPELRFVALVVHAVRRSGSCLQGTLVCAPTLIPSSPSRVAFLALAAVSIQMCFKKQWFVITVSAPQD